MGVCTRRVAIFVDAAYLLLWQIEVLPDGSNFLGHQRDSAGLNGPELFWDEGLFREAVLCTVSHAAPFEKLAC